MRGDSKDYIGIIFPYSLRTTNNFRRKLRCPLDVENRLRASVSTQVRIVQDRKCMAPRLRLHCVQPQTLNAGP